MDPELQVGRVSLWYLRLESLIFDIRTFQIQFFTAQILAGKIHLWAEDNYGEHDSHLSLRTFQDKAGLCSVTADLLMVNEDHPGEPGPA